MKTIRELRTEKGMTQTEFAAWIGVSLSTVAKWEAREVEPTARQLRTMAALLSVAMESVSFDAINRKSRARPDATDA